MYLIYTCLCAVLPYGPLVLIVCRTVAVAVVFASHCHVGTAHKPCRLPCRAGSAAASPRCIANVCYVELCTPPANQVSSRQTHRQRDRQTDTVRRPVRARETARQGQRQRTTSMTAEPEPHYARQLGRHCSKADGPAGRMAEGVGGGGAASIQNQPAAQREREREREREHTALIADQARL